MKGDFTVLVPASGGGLAAGIAFGLKELRPGCRILAIQPKGNGSLARSFDAGRPVSLDFISTCADALVASCPGEKTFAILKKYLNGVTLVEEESIQEAVRFLEEKEGLKVEPGGAVGVAVLLSSGYPAESPTICVLSGCNRPS